MDTEPFSVAGVACYWSWRWSWEWNGDSRGDNGATKVVRSKQNLNKRKKMQVGDFIHRLQKGIAIQDVAGGANVPMSQCPLVQWAPGHWHYERTLHSRRPLRRDRSFYLSIYLLVCAWQLHQFSFGDATMSSSLSLFVQYNFKRIHNIENETKTWHICS